jgi:hypothetical protein
MDNNQSSLLLCLTKKQTNTTKHIVGKRLDNYLLFVVVSNQEKKTVIKHVVGNGYTIIFLFVLVSNQKKTKYK